MNKLFFSWISLIRISYRTIWLKTWSWYKNQLKNEIWKGLNRYLPKDAHQKSDGESVKSDLKKLYSFTLEMSKNYLIRSFLRNERLRVKVNNSDMTKMLKTDKITTFFQNQLLTCYLTFNIRPTYFSIFRKINANSYSNNDKK